MKKFLILVTLVTALFLLASCSFPGTQTPGTGEPGPSGDPNCEHEYLLDRAEKATCTETGLTAREYCHKCGYVKAEAEVIPALGHTKVAIPAVEATCLQDGATAGVKCTACNQTLVKPTTIPKKAHQAVTTPDIAATCTTAGSTGGTHCSICSTTIEAPEVILPFGHDRGLEHIIITEGYAPTCSETGLSDNLYCTICETDVVVAKVIDVVPHAAEDLEVVPGYAATCVATGLTDGEICKACGVTTVEQVEIPVDENAHPADSIETLAAVEVTCYADGKTEGKFCTACEVTYLPQEDITERPDHVLVIVDEAVAPDCVNKTNGSTASYICANADEGCTHEIKSEVVEYTHVHGEWITHIEPGVGTAGEKHTYCTVCGEYIEEQIPALLPDGTSPDEAPDYVDPDGTV